MRRPRSITLFGLAAPLLLMQTTPSGCLSDGTGGGGSPLFNLPPTAVLTSDVQRGVAPLKVYFSSSGSSDDGVIVRREWDFGDGVGTSQEISPTYTFQSNGIFTVRLTLTDDRGATSSTTIVISVTERPIAIIAVDRTTAETAPATFEFDGSASFDPDAAEGETLLYRWDFGDGSRELLASVSHTFATAGTYRVRLTVTDAVGVTGSADKIIEVGIPRPTISFRAPPADIANLVCSPSALLWVHAAYSVTPGVPYTLRAGLDGDRDACSAQVVLYTADSRAELASLVDPTTDPEAEQGAVRAAVYAPVAGSTRALVGGDDGVVRLYDTISGVLLRRYGGTGAGVRSLAFAPDAATFAVGYSDGTLVLRETNSNDVIRPFVGHVGAVNAVAFSADGTQMLAGDDSGSAILWNAADATQALQLDHAGSPVTSVAFSPVDPQRVLTGSADATARLWSTVNGNQLQEFAPVFSNGVLISGHSDAVTSVAFAPAGTVIATGSADKKVKLWDVALGSETATLSGHTDAVRAVAFAPDGKALLSGSDDRTALIWDLATGKAAPALKPCASPITAVAYAPDGSTLLLGVAAKNDFPLDTNPRTGNDLNLTLPTGLDLRRVPTGAEGRLYYLWVEIATDRTTPVRTYSRTRVHVIPEYTSTIGPTTPVIPLRSVTDATTGVTQEVASVVVPAGSDRQIFDLGELDVGDRIYLTLMSVPGYRRTYAAEGLNPLSGTNPAGLDYGFSVMILDTQEKLFAWYESGRVLFTSDTKLIVGHLSGNYYVVLDGKGGADTPSVDVRIQRAFADSSEPRQQYVHLNFAGASNIAVAGSNVFTIPAFTIEGRNAASVNTVRTAVIARVADLLGDYGFVVSASPPPSNTDPRLTIYFDVNGALLGAEIPDRDGDQQITTDDLQFWGLPNYIDPRNATLSGHAVVAVGDMLDVPAIAALGDGQLGLAIGNAAAHQIGLMCGLNETIQPQGAIDDVMTVSADQVAAAALQFTEADLAPTSDMEPIGTQDAPQLLSELFGVN